MGSKSLGGRMLTKRQVAAKLGTGLHDLLVFLEGYVPTQHVEQ